MVKMPAGVPEYQQLLKESSKLIERLENGQRLLDAAIKQTSMTQAFDIIKLYGQLAKRTHRQLEEIAVIHQYYATGQKMFVRRDGGSVFTAPFVENEDVELDPQTLILYRNLTEVFGEVPHDILTIKD